MFQIKHKLTLVFLLFTVVAFSQYTDVINSNRPGKSMSAFSVGETVIQAEGGISGLQEKHDLAQYEANGIVSDLSVRYGYFMEQFELNLDMQYQYDWYQAPLINDTRGGFRQLTLGAKYLIYDPFLKIDNKPNLYSWKANHKFNWRDFIPAVAIYGGLNIRVGEDVFLKDNRSRLTPKIVAITQNHFGNRWVWVNNFYIDKLTSNYQTLGMVSTLTRGFNPRLSGFFEFQGNKNDFYADYLFRGGAAYLLKENIQVDASLTKNIKDTPAIMMLSLGCSWRFDSEYERIYIQKPKKDKDKKGKKGKKGKKDKGKNKKRRDEVELTPNP
jgi:hypothetical protein